MKIELKNTDFKQLFEFLDESPDTMPIDNIIESLRKQYDKAFNKYQNEKQEFNIGEKVKFKWPNDWLLWDGVIKKVSQLANGKYKYIVEYEDHYDDVDGDENREVINGMVKRLTNPLTKKNIIKHE
jgi:hypothetical protein